MSTLKMINLYSAVTGVRPLAILPDRFVSLDQIEAYLSVLPSLLSNTVSANVERSLRFPEQLQQSRVTLATAQRKAAPSDRAFAGVGFLSSGTTHPIHNFLFHIDAALG